jgi:glucokinase
MTPAAPILVADIGGTNARFAIASRMAERYTISDVMRLSAAQWPSLPDALSHYLEATGHKPARAALAVAGPVTANIAALTNSPWTVDGPALAKAFGLARVRVVNDFSGQARGAILLPPQDLLTIAPGVSDAAAPIAVLGPGTGLGLAYLHRGETAPIVAPTEGGHTAFAPCTDEERRVGALLAARHGYVSFERVCSGLGISAVYAALKSNAGAEDAVLPAEDISARTGSDPLAAQTMELFFAALGTFAGNAVLMGGARGGVYLGGGILPKLPDALLKSDFLQRFYARGPMSTYVADVPVTLILSADTALYGAAALADEG